MSLISNAYIKFLNKVESNITNDNISANKQTFIFNFNDNTVTLYHTENIETGDTNTLFETEF